VICGCLVNNWGGVISWRCRGVGCGCRGVSRGGMISRGGMDNWVGYGMVGNGMVGNWVGYSMVSYRVGHGMSSKSMMNSGMCSNKSVADMGTMGDDSSMASGVNMGRYQGSC